MAKPRKKLDISCGDSDCNSGMHCFRVTAKKVSQFAAGSCQDCGEEPVNFERVQKRSLNDIENTFASLGHEYIRNVFLNMPLGVDAQNYAKRKGRIKLQEAVRKRLAQSIGRAHPFRDGTQTPLLEDSPNPIWNAQHATATCCRRCIEYWHGVPRGRALSGSEMEYMAGLVNKFLDEKLPGLPDEPTKVPRNSIETSDGDANPD